SYVYLANTKHSTDYTQCIIFKNYLLHRNCIPKLWDIKLTIKSQTSPLTLNQKSVLIAIKIAKMTSKEKILLFKTIFPKPTISKLTPNQTKDNISETTIEDENDKQQSNEMETDEFTNEQRTKLLPT